MKLKFLLFAFLMICGLSELSAGQQKPVVTSAKNGMNWYDLQKQQSPILQGVGWNDELKGTYGRLPSRAKEKVRSAIWNLAGQCAGISVRFSTNAPEVKVIYQVSDSQSFPHMPATGVSGLDLYTTDDRGKPVWSAGRYTFGDTIKYTFKNLTSLSGRSKLREYQLFLPLYNHVKWIELGVATESDLSWIAPSADLPIVVYGTSIAQGGCASRPGMAWTGILNRELPYTIINLGFSGNGLLEKEVLNLISEIEAKLYIFDCLPNLVAKTSTEIETATVEAVRQIRKLHQTPILLVEHAGYTDSSVDRDKLESYTRANKASKASFDQLKKEGIQNLFYLSSEEINMPMDGMVDGVHPTDYGMRAYADAYKRIIRKILRN